MNLTGNLLPGQKLTGRIKSLTVLTISAYGVAVKNGYKGTEEEWLTHLSAYGIACKNGFKGTEEEWLTYLSAYGIACKNGFVGTEEEWLASLEANPERIKAFVEEYLSENPTQVDTTLTTEGMAADAKATGEAIKEAEEKATTHIEKNDNPHGVTKAQVGLSNVDNTSDVDKPVSTAQAEAINLVQTAADNAHTAAANAQTAANNAQTAADNAQTTADNAQTAANNALTDSKAYTDSKHLIFTATLSTLWSESSAPFTQSVSLSGILSTDRPHVFPNYSTTQATRLAQKEAWSKVCDLDTYNGSIIFTCFEEKPTTAIPIQIEVNR